MASGGSIVVRIGGDDKELQAALTRAKQGLGQLGRQMRAGVGTAAKYSAALAAVGTAITAAFVKSHMSAIDATAKFSDQIGIATKDLTQFQYAAKEAAGVSEQTFNMALRRMNRRIAEAAQGAGPAASAIKELGLSAQELKDAGPAEALRRISDAMQHTGTQSDRLRIAFKLFDTDGGALLPMLQEGSAGLAEYAKQADALGKSFSRVDAAQVEAANAAIDRIGDVISGVGNQLAIQLAPFVEEVATRLTALSAEAGGFGGAITAAVEKSMRGMGYLGNVMRGLHVTLKGLTLAFQALGTGVLSISSQVYEGWQRIFELITAGIGQAVRAVNNIPGVEIPTEGIDRLRDSLRASADAQVQLRQTMSESLAQTARELHELAMQPMPADQIEAFLQAVRERSREAAEEVAAARAAMTAGGDGEVDVRAEEEAERHRKEIADRIERIRQGLLTEREVELEAYAAKREALAEAKALELLSEEEHRAQLEAVEQAHWERMAQIREAGLSDLQRFTESSFRSQVQTVSRHLADMTAGVARENKAMFEINKVAGIANAIVSAHEGISLTMSKYPYPLNIGMAAAHAAAAFAQVNAIRSQSFGGGGGAAPSLAGGTPAPPTTPVSGGTPEGGNQQATIINLHGDTFGRQQIRDLLEQINESSADGGRLVIA